MGERLTLDELISAVEGATGPDHDLDVALTEYFVNAEEADLHQRATLHMYRFTHSIDAALGLVVHVLPGYRWGIHCHAGMYRAHVTESSALRPMPNIADKATPALAIILATLRALKHKEAGR